MIHESLQTNVIRENGLRCLTNTAVRARRMCRRRIQLAQQETSLRTSSITDNESRKRKAVLDKVFRVFLGGLEQGTEVLVAFLILISGLAPLGHGLAVEDENVEESVEEEDSFGLDGGGIQEHRLAALVIEAVAIEGGLNHNEGVANVLVIQDVSIEGCLVG
jgi:hypothetical protein